MSHFAELGAGDIVLRVIVAEQDFIDTLPGTWLQCSYNTHGGVHSLGGTPLRMNYPGVGWTYDSGRDAFIPPQPPDIDGFGAWTLDESTCLWQPPAGYSPE